MLRFCSFSSSALHDSAKQGVLWALVLGLVGCAPSSPAPPATPTSTAPLASAPAASASELPAASSAPSSNTAPPPAEATAANPPTPASAENTGNGASTGTSSGEQPSEPRRAQPVTEVLTARDAAFLVDYANSDARERANETCDKESKGDPEAKGLCLAKARDEFQADVLRFRKENDTRGSLVIYKRNGTALREVYVGAYEFADETNDSVRVKFTGRERGLRPIFRQKKEGIFRVPNDYSVEIDDPQFGKLTYNAKIGLLSE
jgi:hypothetical protein